MNKYEIGLKIDSGALEGHSRKGDNMSLDKIIKILTLDDYVNCRDWCMAYDKAVQITKQLSSLESEYNAYHTDSDYWKGIKYAIDVLNHE